LFKKKIKIGKIEEGIQMNWRKQFNLVSLVRNEGERDSNDCNSA